MKPTDFNNFYLTDEEKQAFSLFKDSDQAILTFHQFELLLNLKLVTAQIGDNYYYVIDLSSPSEDPEEGTCYLSDLGIRYRDFLNEHSRQHAEKIKEQKRQYFLDTFLKCSGYLIAYLLGLFTSEIKDILMSFF